jgi:hypothetical protein
VLRKQTIPLATALGRVTTTLLATPMGISITALLVTVLRRQIKSGAGDPLEKVTGHQDDKPINRRNSQGNTHARENCCWRKRSLQQHSACDYTGEQPQQQLCLRNNPNKDLKKEDTTKPGI